MISAKELRQMLVATHEAPSCPLDKFALWWSHTLPEPTRIEYMDEANTLYWTDVVAAHCSDEDLALAVARYMVEDGGEVGDAEKFARYVEHIKKDMPTWRRSVQGLPDPEEET